MYVLHDCQSSDGSWKAKTLQELKDFAETWLNISAGWIHFRGRTVCLSECQRYEAEKVDGREDWVREIPFV